MNCKTTSHEGCYQNQNSFDFDYLMEEIDSVMQEDEGGMYHDSKGYDTCDIDRKCCRHMEKCDFDTWTLAMAYVPMQPWEKPYELEKGLNSGTIFPGLDLPFLGGGCR